VKLIINCNTGLKGGRRNANSRWRKKTGGNRRGEQQNNGLGDKPSDNFFSTNFLFWREQNQFVLGITQIPLKSRTPRSFKRDELDGVEFLYWWDPSCRKNVPFSTLIFLRCILLVFCFSGCLQLLCWITCSVWDRSSSAAEGLVVALVVCNWDIDTA